MRVLFHTILVIASIVYMRTPNSNHTVPWVLVATPLASTALSHLTLLEKSFHLYSLERLLLLVVLLYAVAAWYTQPATEELLFLNLIFFTILAT